MGEVVEEPVHYVYAPLSSLHAHVDVEPEDVEPAPHHLEVLKELHVATVLGYLLVSPERKGVGGGVAKECGVFFRGPYNRPHLLPQVLIGLGHSRADPGDDLEVRHDELVLDGFAVFLEGVHYHRRGLHKAEAFPVEKLALELHAKGKTL